MRILLIEDHPIVRAGCRRLLQGVGGTDVREAATAADGLRLAVEFAPDVIILDLRLPDGGGLDLLRPLMSCACAAKIIVFSMYEDASFAARALEMGAKGYITKNDDPDLLLRAIETTAGGGIFLTASMAERLALLTMTVKDDSLPALSSREREVLVLLGEGKTLAEMADLLGLSYRSSASIVAHIKGKLHVNTTAALIKWAVEHQRPRRGSGDQPPVVISDSRRAC